MCNKHSQAFTALLDAHEPYRMGPLFLDWLADRLVCVYGESENIDFVLCLRRRADKARKAIALAESVKNEKHQAFTDMLAALEELAGPELSGESNDACKGYETLCLRVTWGELRRARAAIESARKEMGE